MSKGVRHEFARSVADLRAQLQLDEEEFADLIGITVDHLQRLESGRAGVSIKTLQKINDATGAKPVLTFVTGDLISGEQPAVRRRSGGAKKVELPRIDNFDPEPVETSEEQEGEGQTLSLEQRTRLTVHEYADIFARKSGAALQELIRDIRQNGLVNPIVITINFEILDGRARYDACIACGVEPRFVVYHGDDPIGVVDSLNA